MTLIEAVRTTIRRLHYSPRTEEAYVHVFPASRPCVDPATGRLVLHHLHETALQRAIQEAARAANIDRRASCHTLRK
jgi:integrase